MKKSNVRNYVLVHGAWHGGWVWRQVADALRAMSHTVTTPTLTGLGERRHLVSQQPDLLMHVEDVVANIHLEGLSNIVLVGWSYGGMVISGVLEKIQEDVASMIYLDAFMPEKGQAVIDCVEPAAAGAFQGFIDQEKDIPPIIPLEVFGVDDQAVREFVNPRLVPQPFRTFVQPSTALAERPPGIPHTYIRCSGFPEPSLDAFLASAQSDSKFDARVMNTSHLAMLTDPRGLSEILANAE